MISRRLKSVTNVFFAHCKKSFELYEFIHEFPIQNHGETSKVLLLKLKFFCEITFWSSHAETLLESEMSFC